VEIMGLFRRLSEVGVTMLVASHDLALVERLRARRLVLDGGRLVDAAPDPAGGTP
jgi:cell division transport system ATP-binding protein